MKKSKTILAGILACALLVLLFTGGCSKSDNTPPILPHDPWFGKIKTTHEQGQNVDTFFYDSSARCIKQAASDGSYVSYVYSSGLVTRYHFNAGQTIASDTTIYTLNSQGYVSSDGTDSYTYDSAGYQTSRTLQPGGIGPLNFTDVWRNENLDSLHYETQPTGFFWAYTYFTDKINTIGNDNAGFGIWGKSSKNLLSSSVYKFAGSISTNDFTYEFDANNRVTKLTQTATGSGTGSIVVSYTYYD